jgi:chloramphenicol-sensitive protein RarD
MAPMSQPQSARQNTGILLGLGAYIIWGLLPLYLKLLHAAPAAQILAHRILWSVLLLAVIVLLLKRGGAICAAARGRTLLLLMASALLIAVNWLVYIWSVQNGRCACRDRRPDRDQAVISGSGSNITASK